MPSRKLSPKFVGLFPVVRKINNVAYELKIPFHVHPVFHVALLKPSDPGPFFNRNTGPPEPVLINGEEEF